VAGESVTDVSTTRMGGTFTGAGDAPLSLGGVCCALASDVGDCLSCALGGEASAALAAASSLVRGTLASLRRCSDAEGGTGGRR